MAADFEQKDGEIDFGGENDECALGDSMQQDELLGDSPLGESMAINMNANKWDDEEKYLD